jgi:hypothetical protein
MITPYPLPLTPYPLPFTLYPFAFSPYPSPMRTSYPAAVAAAALILQAVTNDGKPLGLATRTLRKVDAK